MGIKSKNGLSGLKPHHLSPYPTMEIAVDMTNAFRLPHRLAIHVIMGIIKNAVAIALTVENHAGQLPARP